MYAACIDTTRCTREWSHLNSSNGAGTLSTTFSCTNCGQEYNLRAGHITPKSEWMLREALALTGKYDRNEIDTLTAQAVAALA